MTFQSSNEEESDAQISRSSHEVGYGKPPREHRFKKGQSGNPFGRPRKARPIERHRGDGFGTQPANRYLLQEAYRTVLIREGDKTIELPAIQAVFRSMGVSAMKGNRYAQRMLAELVQSVESAHRQSRLEYFKTAVDYKCTWEENIEFAHRSGRPEPQPIPHPDDIILDFVAGNAIVCGPMTKEEKAEWDKLLNYRDAYQKLVSHFAEKYRKARTPKGRAEALGPWKNGQKLYDEINDNLPRRYRKFLEGRCLLDGASQPGDQKKRFWPGDD